MLQRPMSLSKRTVLLAAILGCTALGVVRSATRLLPSQRETYKATASSAFTVHHGDKASGPLAGLNYWSSFDQGAREGGTVSIGPFPAPDHLRFAVRGYPAAPGNKIFLELEFTKFRIPIMMENTGASWHVVDFDLPLGWRGWRISLNAVSGADSATSGFEISQPYGWRTGGTRQYGLLETLTAWIANGLLYGLVFVTAAHWLARRNWVEPFWIALVAAGVVAGIGYLTFWAYFASPILGKAFSVSVFCAMAALNASGKSRFDGRDREWVCAGSLAVCVGLLYIGILHLFPVQRDIYQLAASRFIETLPGDNRLPFDFANMLYNGQRPRELGAGWLSSDRPPLQEGWQLIAWPVTKALGFSDQTSSATAAMWLQMSWVFSLWGLLRALGLPLTRSFAWIAALSLNGFFLLHTVYTWPKLSAGAFVCGGFGVWFLGAKGGRLGRHVAGAELAALACLSHGGVAFSLIALIPWILWRCIKGEFLQWTAVAAAFFITVSPWLAYQRYFAPPGDRLLRWHLAGQTEIDHRPLWRTVADAYHSLSWGEILQRKESNLAFQFSGDWGHAADATVSGAPARRASEADHMFRAVGWWNSAILILAVSLLGAPARERARKSLRGQCSVALWILATVVVWCVLLFDTAIVPQGSLAVVISIFALCAFWVDCAGRWWMPVFLAAQTYTLASTWMPGNASVGGSVSYGAGADILLGCAALVCTSLLLVRRDACSPDAAT